MSEIIPEGSEYLTAEDLQNPDNEIIFVQHSEEVEAEKIKSNLENFLAKNHGKNMTLREIEGSPYYPVAFENGKMVVSKKFDKYVVALPRRK